MTPGIAPIFGNNPGYSILTYNDEDVTQYEFKWRFLQLQEYFLFRYQQWQTYNPEHLYPIKLTDADTVRSFSRQLLTDQRLFTRYLLTKMGFREALANAASYVYPLV